MASIVNFYRGPQSAVDAISELEDGRLYFCTDSKKIQMDCVHTDSLNNAYNKRITFGGSTGIYYGTKKFAEDEDFTFSIDDLDNADELPSVDDLILNSDGSFYRVSNVLEAQQEIETTRLTLSGSGGGGGTGSIGLIYKTYISDRISYHTMQDTDIPVMFSCYSSMDNSPVTAEVIVNGSSMEHIENIKKDQVVSVNLADYDGRGILKTNAANTIKINLVDDYDNSTTMTYTVYLYDMYIVIPDTQVMPQPSDYEFVCKPYGGTTGNLTNRAVVYELRREGAESILWTTTVTTTADKGENISYLIPHQEHGSYILSVYIQASIPNSTRVLVSPSQSVQIPFYNASESAPLITVSNAPSGQVTQYDKAKIGYMVTYAATTTSDVNLKIEIDRGSGRELLRTSANTISNGSYYYWDVSFDEVGVYYLIIELANSEYRKTLSPVSVKKYDKDIPAIDTGDTSLRLILSAKNRSNTETNKDTWVSKIGSEEIACQFSGFNWETNGWLEDSEGATALHLTNGAKLVIPYSPFAPDSSNNGAEKTGRTIELDFRISNIRNFDVPAITCKSSKMIIAEGKETENINTGIVIYGNKSQMNSKNAKSNPEDMSGWTTMFKEGTRIHLSYVINSNTDNPARIFYTFLNGITSSLSNYAPTDQFVDLSDVPSKFIFDSTYMDIDIYNIRVYSLSKTPTFILKNAIADSATPDEAAAKWVDNNMIEVLGDGDTGISLDKVIELGNIPYMVFYDGRQTSDKKDKGWGKTYPIDPPTDTSEENIVNYAKLPTAKKDFRHVEMYYVDPNNPDNNIPEGTIATIYGQGTSSMEYPVKNLRIYFKKLKYKLFPEQPGVPLFTLKADYMESSSSHNTGTANVLDKMYKSVNLESPAQQYYPENQRVLTAIKGKPIVCFFKPYMASKTYPNYYKYIGRYNFNFDKATHELFGFESLKAEESRTGTPYGYLVDENNNLREGFNTATEFVDGATYYLSPSLSAQKITFEQDTEKDREKAFLAEVDKGPLYLYKKPGEGCTTVQCWEFLNNTSKLVGFRKEWNEEEDRANGYKEWTGSFESRYPEHETEESSDKRSMARVVNWVASTNRHPDVIKAYLTEQSIDITDETIATEDERRLNKFKNEFSKYFIKDFVSFYYVVTEFLMMIDSRGKNMMFACYDADPDRDVGHWIPIFYDMDTMLGVDNSGVLRFAYDAEDDMPDTFNVSASYSQTQYSVLWCNFKEAFKSDIQQMYHNLRKGGQFDYNTFLANYNDNQADAWNETYINEDADFKYIDPILNNYTVEVDGVIKYAKDYLYAAQGTRSQHRAYWLDRRFNYLDSKYDYTHRILGTNSAPLSVRLNSSIEKSVLPFNADQTLTTQYDQYITVQHLNGAWEGPIRMNAGETKTISVPITTATDQECYIFGLENVSDMGVQADKYYNKFQLQSPVKLRRLEVGSFVKGFENANLGTANAFVISGFMPYLEYLNIQNCSGIKSSLDLSSCPYLQELYAYGTNLTSISFFNGGNLKHIELPATTSSLFLRSQLYFDTFTTRTDEEIAAIREKERLAAENSIRASLTKREYSEDRIQQAVDAIEINDIQKEHLTCERYDYLTTLRISNCPLVDSKGFVKKLLNKQSDGTYTTNLANFRLDDVNWTITKDECVIENNNGKNQVKNIPILDVLASIHGIDSADKLTSRLEAGNDYFAGTITIDNDDTFGIDELTLYKLYGKLFPGLSFKYNQNSHCMKAYFIGINNALNQVEQMYSKKCAADDIDNISATLTDWFTPKYIDGTTNWDTSHVPPIIKTSSDKYDYEFVGWSLDNSQSFNEDDYTSSADRIKAAKDACAILVEKDADGNYSAKANNGFVLTESSFNENQEINFYPVYMGIIRFYDVKFFWRKDGTDTLLKKDNVKYGTAATPPSPPMWVELPENDVTVAYTYPFTGYNIPFNDVRNEINTYAQFGEKVDLRTVPSDESYFTNVGPGDDERVIEGIALQLNDNFEGEAITIPKEFKGNKVIKVQVQNYSASCPNLRRMFFEDGNEIINLYAIRNGQSNFEYLDFDALPKLKIIGDAALQGCSNLVCNKLPDTIVTIGVAAFYGCSKLNIPALPRSLSEMGKQAFDSCSSQGMIDLNNTSLNVIPDSAFNGCTSLQVKTQNINCSIKTLGDYAFQGCTELVMNFGNSGEDCSIENIGMRCFSDTPNLNMNNLPARLTSLATSTGHGQAFVGRANHENNNVYFTVIPASITAIGDWTFQHRKFPQGVLRIENPNCEISANAFKGTSGIRQIYVHPTVDQTNAPWGAPTETEIILM